MVVLRIDKFSQTANDPTDFPSSLFNGAQRTRQTPQTASPAGPAMPLGLITFEGRIDAPLRLGLALPETDRSDFLGHWPGYAGKGETSLAWHSIQHVGENPRRSRIRPDNHWLIPMSEAKDRIHFNSRGQTSRFIAYDPSFAYEPAFEVKLEDEAYCVAGESLPSAPLIMLIKRDGDQFFATRADPDGRFDMQTPPHADAHTALAPLEEAFRAQGYSPTETDTVLAMVTQAGMATDNLAMVYLLDQPTLDTIIPLTLSPALEPDDQIIRQGVVVVTNVDPMIGSIVETLIAKLGDPAWPVREEAHQQLLAMDRAAIDQIRQHTDHADPEIAYRIEQILNAQPANR